MIFVHAAAVRSTRTAVEETHNAHRFYFNKGGDIMVELDQYRYELSGYTGPLEELRDSL